MNKYNDDNDDKKDGDEILEAVDQMLPKKTRTVDAEKIKEALSILLRELTLANLALNDSDTTKTDAFFGFCYDFGIKKLDDLTDEQVPDALLHLIKTLQNKRYKRDIK